METTSLTPQKVGQSNHQEMSTWTCLSHRSPLCLEGEKGGASGWGNSSRLPSISSKKSWHGAWPVLQGQVGRGIHKRGTGVGKDLEKQMSVTLNSRHSKHRLTLRCPSSSSPCVAQTTFKPVGQETKVHLAPMVWRVKTQNPTPFIEGDLYSTHLKNHSIKIRVLSQWSITSLNTW